MNVLDNIMSWTKEEMVEVAKALNIKGRSKMNKSSLAKAMTDILLTEEYFKTVLFALNKEQVELVEKWCQDDNETLDVFQLSILVDWGYITLDEERAIFCEDAKELFLSCYTEEFKSGVEIRSKIVTYCNVFAELYGIIPLDKVFEIYDKQNHDISEADFMNLMSAIGGKTAVWEIYNNAVVDSYILMEGDYDELLDLQSNKPFYIPSRKKIMKMSKPDYIDETNAYIALRHYLVRQLGVDETVAENVCGDVEMECKIFDCDIPDILCIFDQYNIELKDKNIKRVVELVEAVDLNTRKAVHRGFTDLEIEEKLVELEDDIFPFLF